jgi:hypothetical protein
MDSTVYTLCDGLHIPRTVYILCDGLLIHPMVYTTTTLFMQPHDALGFLMNAKQSEEGSKDHCVVILLIY